MNGIVGIFNRDRAPVSRGFLQKIVGAESVWAEGEVGFGHTEGKQPCTLDGEVWIAADARVDARPELVDELESLGCRDVRQASDPELILHAYQVWGEKSLEHLIGDFAFLIWDRRRRLLFGARDHFGVKPFYYAEAGKSLLCGNILKPIRLHPAISEELNDLAVADFLLFGDNQDPAATYFAGIQRLPPGHCLIATETALRVQRYWTLSFQEVRFRRQYDYVERFHELFTAAVKDRVRADKAVVFMSGGLDSTLVAAYAQKARGQAPGIRAQTVVYDRIIPDQERKYSQLAADFISIPIEHLAADDFKPFTTHLDWVLSKAEPDGYPLAGLFFEQYKRVVEHAQVVLTGFGGDPVLHMDDGCIARYLKIQSLWELAEGIGWCFWAGRRLPRLGFRRLARNFIKGKTSFRPPYPAWLNHDLESRLGLAERWERFNPPPVTSPHGRAAPLDYLGQACWQTLFQNQHSGVTGFPIEHRHPFFDLRVLRFLTGIPPLPWCQEKNMLKAAGRGMLPEAVLLRPKTRLAGEPVWEHVRRCDPGWWAEHFDPSEELARYTDRGIFPGASGSATEVWQNLRLVSLNYWLRSGRSSRKILNTQ